MTPGRAGLAALALLASTALHGAGFLRLGLPEQAKIAGGAAASVAVLGDGFADLAEGGLAAMPVESTARMAPHPTEAAASRPVPPTATLPPAPLAAAQPALPPLPGAGSRRAPEPPRLDPVPEVRPAQAEDPRPKPRPEPKAAAEPARSPRAADPKRSQQAKAAPEPAGNADRTARRGSVTGASSGQDAGGGGQAAAAAGNAQASDYGGAVLRRISRLSRPRSPARGVVVVGFTIGADGGLADVRVLRASGSEALDRIALEHIRRAAPFPAPPEGARRDWSFEFVGRP